MIHAFFHGFLPGSLKVSLSTQRVVTAKSTQIHDDIRTVPLQLVLFPLTSLTFDLTTFGINQHLSEHCEIKSYICSFFRPCSSTLHTTGQALNIGSFRPFLVAMPSRNRKVLHDSKVTNSFFNQVDSTICPCCNGRNQNHAILPMEPGSSSDLSKDTLICCVIKTNDRIGDETAASVIAFWGEMLNNLTPEERQKWQSFIDIQETIPDPESVKQELKRALKLAYKEISDTLATADHFPPMDTFDLSNLEEAAEAYDLLCEKYQGEEELEIAQIAGRVSNLAVTASDVNCSSDDRLAAELDMQILNIHSKITVPLTACLRQAQLFNIDKKFGFVEESYQALSHDDRKRRGEDVPAELPTSFRQKLNNPSKLIESASEQSKKKNKKKFNLDDTLVKFQHNVQLMTEEFEELKKTVSDAVKPIELPSPPSSFTYAGVPVPEGIPDHIQQRFFDAAFALKEVIGLQPEAYEHRRHVQGTLSIWYKAGHEIWYVCSKCFPL